MKASHKKFPFSTALAARLLLAIAALLSLYLASISLSQTGLRGCDDASPCYRILFSKWAYAFGLPVSFGGLAIYCAALSLANAFEKRSPSWLGVAAESTMLIIAFCAVWFIGLQFLVFQEFCPWCTLTHLCAVSGVALLATKRSGAQLPEFPLSKKKAWRTAAPFLAMAAGLSLVITGSFLGNRSSSITLHALPSAETGNSSPTIPPGSIALHKGRFQFAPSDFPLIGEPTAQVFAVALVDYTCDFCRDYHKPLAEVQLQRGENFAIVLLPAFRDEESRAIQKAMLTFFNAAPKEHGILAARILSGEIPARLAPIEREIVAVLGIEGYATATQSHKTWTESKLRLTRSIQDANKGLTNNARLPQVMTGDQVLIGYYPAETINDFLDGRDALLTLAPSEAAKKGFQPPPNGQAMTIPSPRVDLGDVQAGGRIPCEVTVQNTSQSPLKIGWVSLEPGCEVTNLPSGPIPPGTMATITFLVDAPSNGSSFERTVRIHGTDMPGGPQITSVVKIGGKLTKDTLPSLTAPLEERSAIPLAPPPQVPAQPKTALAR